MPTPDTDPIKLPIFILILFLSLQHMRIRCGTMFLTISCSFLSYFQVLILGTGECRSLEIGVVGKNYESHVNRSRGWTNECIGYHINGNESYRIYYLQKRAVRAITNSDYPTYSAPLFSKLKGLKIFSESVPLKSLYSCLIIIITYSPHCFSTFL